MNNRIVPWKLLRVTFQGPRREIGPWGQYKTPDFSQPNSTNGQLKVGKFSKISAFSLKLEEKLKGLTKHKTHSVENMLYNGWSTIT